MLRFFLLGFLCIWIRSAQDLPIQAAPIKVPAIFRAITTKNHALFFQLVSKKEQREGINQHGATPLIEAVKLGWTEAIDELLRRGVHLEARDEWGWTALMVAAGDGQLSTLKKLVLAGADFNAKDHAGIVALSWAAINAHREVVDYLLELGADFRSSSKVGNSAIDYAITNGNCAIYKALKSKGAVPSEKYQNQLALFLGRSCVGEFLAIGNSSGPGLELEVQRGITTAEVQEEPLWDNYENLGSASEPILYLTSEPNWDSRYFELMQVGHQAFYNNKFAKAEEQFQLALTSSKDESLSSLYWLCRAQMMQNMSQKALENFERYLSKAKLPLEKAAACTQMANILHSGTATDQQRARQLLRDAFNFSQCNWPESYLAFAKLSLAQNRESEAMLAYEELLARSVKPELRNQLVRDLDRLRRKARRSNLTELVKLPLHFEDGSIGSIGEMKGKVTLIECWSSWSLSYQNALPQMKEMAAQWRESEFSRVGFNLDICTWRTAQFAELQQIPKPQLSRERNPEFLQVLAAEQWPAFILVDADGKILAVEQGWNAKQRESLEKTIQKALAKLRKTDGSKSGL